MSIETWLRRGTEARLAHEAVHAAFSQHVRDIAPDRYDALLRDFRAKTAAALPSSDPHFMPGLSAGQPRFIETAIAFLEADPWFFRSGYEKERLIRHLKRGPLTAAQQVRLGLVVLAAIDGRDRREFRHYCRLACGVWNETLEEQVAERIDHIDIAIRRRALWVAQAVGSSGKA